MEKTNRLMEAVIRRDGESKWLDMVDRAKSNPFFAKYAEGLIKEGITSDIAGALGRYHDVVIEAAKPNLIGREIVQVMATDDALVRFPKAVKAVAYQKAESASYWVTGEQYATEDVSADIEITAGGEWSKRFFEDAKWSVLERQAKEVGRAIAQLETTKILLAYKSITAASLAGGADLSLNEGANFAWTDVVSLWNTLAKADYSPKVLVINTREMQGVINQNQFIQSLYYAPESTIRTGVFDLPVLGMRLVYSTLVPAYDATHNYKFAIDTDVAGVLLIRRDITTEPFENPRDDLYGVVASERVGIGVLREDAVARGY